MELKEYISSPELSRYVKVIPAGEWLFKQGQLGHTLFIMLDGLVELIAEKDGSEHVDSLLEAGQFLGEKAIFEQTPHQRLFGARARTNTTVMELSKRDVEHIENAHPSMMTDIFKRAFLIATERLSKANYLVRALRSSDNVERLVHCINYFSRQSGKRSADGIEVEIAVDSIHYYIDMEKTEIASWLDELVGRKLLIRASEVLYRIPDQSALLAFAGQYRDTAA